MYVPIYDGVTSKESYLEMIHEFSVLLEIYPLMQDEANVGNTANSFRDCLRGTPKAKFHDILVTPVTWATFQQNVWTLTRRVLGPSALRDQLAF